MLHIVKRIQCEPDTPHTKKKEKYCGDWCTVNIFDAKKKEEEIPELGTADVTMLYILLLNIKLHI